jgi:hypothetical protein
MILQHSLIPISFFLTVLTAATICLGFQDFFLTAVGSIRDETKTTHEIPAQPKSSKYRPLDDIKNLQAV